MSPEFLRAADGARAKRWKFSRSPSPAARTPPADDIFAHFRCPEPVPARSPCPDPGPAEEARATAPAGRAARRRDRGGDRGVEVVCRDRAVGPRRRDVLAGLG